MKNIIFILSLAFILILLCDCTPVRNTTFRNNRDKSDFEENAVIVENYKPRFVDTTIIKMPDVVPEKLNISKELTELFDSALKDLDQQDFKSARQKFSSIKNTLNDGDSLYFEADFYVVECDVSEAKYDEAKKHLESMLADVRLHDSVLERVLVRLGQIYCAKNDIKKANQYFSRLIDVNPNSIYNKVANCDFLKAVAK